MIDEAVTFLRLDPAMLLGSAIVVLLPLRLIAAAAPGSALRGAQPDELADIFVANFDNPTAVWAAIAALVLDSVALFTVASIYGQVLSVWFSGQSTTTTDVLLASIKRSHLVLAAWIIVHAFEGIAALFCGIGLFLPAAFFSVTAPALGAEKLGPWSAVKRSAALSRRSYVNVMVVWVVSGVGALLLRAAIEFVPSLIGLELLNIPLWVISGVSEFIGAVAATALIAAVSTVLYLDLRVRSEGIDLEMAMVDAFAPRTARGRPVGGR